MMVYVGPGRFIQLTFIPARDVEVKVTDLEFGHYVVFFFFFFFVKVLDCFSCRKR